jgi:trans-2-enoyl-CoA reductase
VILREEHRLRVFENRLRRSKKDEVTGGWRKLHNEELYNLSSSLQVKVDDLGRACSMHEGEEEYM